MFLTAYTVLAQNKAQGGYLVLDDDMELLSAFLAEGTSSDFFNSLPPSTLTVPLVLPVEMALLFSSSLDDRKTVTLLEEYRRTKENVVMVMAMKLYETILLEDTSVAMASQALERKAGVYGLNKEELYSIFEKNGMTKDDLVSEILNGKSPDSIVLEALSIRHGGKNAPDKKLVVLLSILLFIGILNVTIFLAAVDSREKDEKNEESRNDTSLRRIICRKTY